jgi:NMD protein affecting ribosome stability and mRNA decay
MTGPNKPTDYIQQGRKDRLIQELVHDPYMSKRKWSEPTVCSTCGAVYHHGRWTWAEQPGGAKEELCPACHRIQDKVPAGFLSVVGDFFAGHKQEILRLIHNLEEREKAQHPLKRIMEIEEQEGLTITFTDPHLARAVGEALHNAYQGELDYQYAEEEYFLRVKWTR